MLPDGDPDGDPVHARAETAIILKFGWLPLIAYINAAKDHS